MQGSNARIRQRRDAWATGPLRQSRSIRRHPDGLANRGQQSLVNGSLEAYLPLRFA